MVCYFHCEILNYWSWWGFFFITVFFHRYWWFTKQQGKGGDHLLFHSATSTRSRTFRRLFETLHVRWLSRIFNCSPCIYQTATRWDLPPYWIAIWLIDDAMPVCVLDNVILDFCYCNLTRETVGFELALAITIVLRPNQLTKCTSLPTVDVLGIVSSNSNAGSFLKECDWNFCLRTSHMWGKEILSRAGIRDC